MGRREVPPYRGSVHHRQSQHPHHTTLLANCAARGVGCPETPVRTGHRMVKEAFMIKYPIGITIMRTPVIPIRDIYEQHCPLQKDCYPSLRTARCTIAFIRYCRIHDSQRLPMAPFVQTSYQNLGEREYQTGSFPNQRNFQFLLQ